MIVPPKEVTVSHEYPGPEYTDHVSGRMGYADREAWTSCESQKNVCQRASLGTPTNQPAVNFATAPTDKTPTAVAPVAGTPKASVLIAASNAKPSC